MLKIPLIPVSFLFLCPVFAWGQSFLEIDTRNSCIYSGNSMDEELYSFGTRVQVMDNLVNKIISLGGDAPKNFSLLQSNVSNVVAVVDNGARYLLWSQDFLEKASRIEAFGSVAHEVGHHLNNHALTSDRARLEEFEADIFMGFILNKANFSEVEIRQYLSTLTPGSRMGGISLNERIQAVMDGFRNAENALKVSGLEFDSDPSMIHFTEAEFPFPPPECHSSYELPLSLFSGVHTLGQVSKKVADVLDKGKYPYRFMSVPGGFAIVTQLEQYNQDGSIMMGSSSRWVEYPPRPSFELSWDYFRSLIYPRKAYLRLFVFLVTNQNYSSSAKRVSKEEARAWLSSGVNRLPRKINMTEFNSDYSVSLLVYEFEVPESNHQIKQRCPCHYVAADHLRLSGLQNGF